MLQGVHLRAILLVLPLMILSAACEEPLVEPGPVPGVSPLVDPILRDADGTDSSDSSTSSEPTTTTIAGQDYATFDTYDDVPMEYRGATADFTRAFGKFADNGDFYYYSNLRWDATEATNTASIFFDPGGGADGGTTRDWQTLPLERDLMNDGWIYLNSTCGVSGTATFDGHAKTRLYLLDWGVFTFAEASDRARGYASQDACSTGGTGDGDEEPEYITWCMVETTYYDDGSSETEILYCWTERAY